MVRRRAMGVLVLGLTVVLGWWTLERDAAKRASQAREATEAAHLLRCPDEGAVVELCLTGPKGTLRLQRGAAATVHEATDAAAGAAAADQDGNAAPTSVGRDATAPLPPAWLLFDGDATAPVAADASTVQATLQAACEVAQLGNALALPDGADLAPFGLAPPRHTLQLRDANGTVQLLEAGVKSSFDGSLYVRRGPGEPVRRVDGSFDFQLERDAFSLRDKRLLRLEPHEVQAVRVAPGPGAEPATPARTRGRDSTHAAQGAAVHGDGEGPATPFALTRDANGPLLEACGRREGADPTAAQALLASVAQLRAARFVADAPDVAALARFGLDRPHLVVAVVDGRGTTHAVRFGRLTLGGEVHHFVQAGAADAPVAELPSAWVVDKLVAGARELRDMRVLALQADEVERFTVTEGAGTVARSLRFVRRGEADVPRARRPFVAEQLSGAAGAPASPVAHLDEARVATALHRLCALRADTLDDAPADAARRHAAGLEPPALTVAFVGFGGETLATLRLGPVRDSHRAAASERRPMLAHVFAAALDGVDASPASWQVAPELAEEPASP